MSKKSYVKADEIQIKGNQIFSPVRRKWIPLTPEERVRQEYLFVLTEEYGFSLDQIAEEESVTGRGSAQALNHHHVAGQPSHSHVRRGASP